MKLSEEIEKFEALQREMLELSSKLEAKKAEYKAQMRATFGLADGEPSSVLDIVKTIVRIKDAT